MFSLGSGIRRYSESNSYVTQRKKGKLRFRMSHNIARQLQQRQQNKQGSVDLPDDA